MDIRKSTITFVTYNEEDFIRFSENSWYKSYGQSWEPHYDSDQVEKEYKKHITSLINDVRTGIANHHGSD